MSPSGWSGHDRGSAIEVTSIPLPLMALYLPPTANSHKRVHSKEISEEDESQGDDNERENARTNSKRRKRRKLVFRGNPPSYPPGWISTSYPPGWISTSYPPVNN
jgi:hypothetical protein